MDKDTVTDPKENPANTGHLPVSGELAVGSEAFASDDESADGDQKAKT
jgi:hypothetical protein